MIIGPNSNFGMPMSSSPFYIPISNDHSHFIVITGISSNVPNPTSSSEMTYVAMDPGNGQEIRFSADNLRSFFTRGSSYYCLGGYLIYHDPYVEDDDIVMDVARRHINSYFPNLDLGEFANIRANTGNIRDRFLFNNQHLPTELLDNIRVSNIEARTAMISVDTHNFYGRTRVNFDETRSYVFPVEF